MKTREERLQEFNYEDDNEKDETSFVTNKYGNKLPASYSVYWGDEDDFVAEAKTFRSLNKAKEYYKKLKEKNKNPRKNIQRNITGEGIDYIEAEEKHQAELNEIIDNGNLTIRETKGE